jgi:hypothetical protein
MLETAGERPKNAVGAGLAAPRLAGAPHRPLPGSGSQQQDGVRHRHPRLRRLRLETTGKKEEGLLSRPAQSGRFWRGSLQLSCFRFGGEREEPHGPRRISKNTAARLIPGPQIVLCTGIPPIASKSDGPPARPICSRTWRADKFYSVPQGKGVVPAEQIRPLSHPPPQAMEYLQLNGCKLALASYGAGIWMLDKMFEYPLS